MSNKPNLTTNEEPRPPKYRKGVLLTEKKLRAMPDNTAVYVVIKNVDPDDEDYKGVAYVQSTGDSDGDFCYLNIGGPDSSFCTTWDFSEDDHDDCCSTDMDGNLLAVYSLRTVKPKAVEPFSKHGVSSDEGETPIVSPAQRKQRVRPTTMEEAVAEADEVFRLSSISMHCVVLDGVNYWFFRPDTGLHISEYVLSDLKIIEEREFFNDLDKP